jgi:DNA-binding GntR family transcriptional regulator
VAGRLGVSATPVREALLDLANEGLIEVRRNRGFLVPVLSDDDLDELFQLRLILEVGAVELLIGRIEPVELNHCWKLEKLIEDCAARRDLKGFLEADREFHLHLLTLVGNKRLVDLVSRLRDQTRLYGLPHLALLGLLDESASEHGRIVQALQDHDVGALRKALTRHITHTRGLWAGRPEEAAPAQQTGPE